MELCLQKYISDKSVLLLNKKSERWIKVKKEYYEKLDEEGVKRLVITQGLAESEDVKERISSVYLFLTHHCNLSCDFCFLKCSPGIEVEKEFDVERIMKYISQIPFSQNIKMVVTGGEPLCKPDLVEILRRLSECVGRENIILQTNGLLLNKEMIYKLKDHIRCVEMSIENVVKDKRLQESMEEKYTILKNAGCEIAFSYVVDSDSVPNLRDAIQLADKYDAYFQMRFVEPIGNGALNYSVDEWKQQYYIMKKSYVAYLEYVIDNAGYDRKYASVISNVLIPREKCGGYGEVVAIHPNGEVFPCGNILGKSMLIADLTQENYSDTSPGFYEQEHVKKHFLVEAKEECSTCEYLYFCNGVCGAIDRDYENYKEYKESTCRIKKEMLYFEMFLSSRAWTKEEYYRRFKSYLEVDYFERMVQRDVEKISI